MIKIHLKLCLGQICGIWLKPHRFWQICGVWLKPHRFWQICGVSQLLSGWFGWRVVLWIINRSPRICDVKLWFVSFWLQHRKLSLITCRGIYSGHSRPHNWRQEVQLPSSSHGGSLSSLLLLRPCLLGQCFSWVLPCHMAQAHHWCNGNSSTNWILLKKTIIV